LNALILLSKPATILNLVTLKDLHGLHAGDGEHLGFEIDLGGALIFAGLPKYNLMLGILFKTISGAHNCKEVFPIAGGSAQGLAEANSALNFGLVDELKDRLDLVNAEALIGADSKAFS